MNKQTNEWSVSLYGRFTALYRRFVLFHNKYLNEIFVLLTHRETSLGWPVPGVSRPLSCLEKSNIKLTDANKTHRKRNALTVPMWKPKIPHNLQLRGGTRKSFTDGIYNACSELNYPLTTYWEIWFLNYVKYCLLHMDNKAYACVCSHTD